MVYQYQVNIASTDEERIHTMNMFLDSSEHNRMVIIDTNLGYNILNYIHTHHYNRYKVVIDIEDEEDSLTHPSQNPYLEAKIIHIRRVMDLETKTLIADLTPFVAFF